MILGRHLEAREPVGTTLWSEVVEWAGRTAIPKLSCPPLVLRPNAGIRWDYRLPAHGRRITKLCMALIANKFYRTQQSQINHKLVQCALCTEIAKFGTGSDNSWWGLHTFSRNENGWVSDERTDEHTILQRIRIVLFCKPFLWLFLSMRQNCPLQFWWNPIFSNSVPQGETKSRMKNISQ